MTRDEAIEYWEGLRKTFSSQLEKEENHFGRMHLQTTIEALDMAISALRQQERFGETNKSLTMDELSKRNDPVFVPINDFPNGGYWCLCENGYIIPPSGHGFMAKERPNWVFYSQKPEEDDHGERKENEHV